MSRRLHDCISCDGKTRHDNPARCAKCRAADTQRVDATKALFLAAALEDE